MWQRKLRASEGKDEGDRGLAEKASALVQSTLEKATGFKNTLNTHTFAARQAVTDKVEAVDETVTGAVTQSTALIKGSLDFLERNYVALALFPVATFATSRILKRSGPFRRLLGTTVAGAGVLLYCYPRPIVTYVHQQVAPEMYDQEEMVETFTEKATRISDYLVHAAFGRAGPAPISRTEGEDQAEETASEAPKQEE